MPSAAKGTKGASTSDSVTRHSCKVAKAASLSASLPSFQKRARERRTYQFESASTKSVIRPVAV